jgi:NarL family two-component system response regulator LiaR
MESSTALESKQGITAQIVSQHPLALTYVLQQMEKDPGILVQAVDDLMLPRETVGDLPIIVLDSYGLRMLPTEYVRTLNDRFGAARYVILDRSFEIQVIYQLLAVGVQGFVTYDEVADFLAIAIRSVHNGGTWVDAAILQKYMKLNRRTRESLEVVDQDCLTTREEEILQLARQRLSNKEIASILGIEVSTVKFHLSNIFSKMNVGGRSDLWRHTIHRMAQQSGPSSGSVKRSGATSPVFS